MATKKSFTADAVDAIPPAVNPVNDVVTEAPKPADAAVDASLDADAEIAAHLATGQRKLYTYRPKSGLALSYDYGYPAERFFVDFNAQGQYVTDDPVVIKATDAFIERNNMGVGSEWV